MKVSASCHPNDGSATATQGLPEVGRRTLTEVAATVGAHDLCPHHPEGDVLVALYCPRDLLKEGGPAAARVELGVVVVQRGPAPCAVVHPRLGVLRGSGRARSGEVGGREETKSRVSEEDDDEDRRPTYVLVVLSRPGHLCALLPQDPELLR